MSTVSVINVKHPSSASNNLVLDNAGNATFAGTAAMASSFLRNRIINGGMDVNQRNAGNAFNCPVLQVTYGIDRFYVYTDGAALTGQRVNPSLNGFPNALRVTSTGASTFTDIGQRIESANIADLAGTTVTISFWAASSSLTGITVYTAYANAQDNFNSTTPIASTSVSITSTLTRYTVSFAIPPQAANGLVVAFVFGAFSSGNTFTLTGVQLEAGTAATAFERRQFGQELALCQRYCYVLPNTSNLANGLWGSMYSSNSGRVWMTLPVTMRAAPSVSGLSGSNTFEILFVAQVSATISGVLSSVSSVTFDGISMTATSVPGQPIGYEGPGVFSAEL